MPIEVALLRYAPVPVELCPKCGKLFNPFLRGQVQRKPYRRKFFIVPKIPQDYCTLICSECKEIIGYESPPTQSGVLVKLLEEVKKK